jgi:glycosyltransferase involved in cell wall biosynthesis
MKAALVDRFRLQNSYSVALGEALRKRIDGKRVVRFYGPKRFNNTEHPYSDFDKVWSPFFYPTQIVRRAIQDRVELIHLQFEFVLFGIPFTPLCVMLLVLAKVARMRVVVTLHGPIYPRREHADIIENLRPSGYALSGSLVHAFVISFYLLMDKLSDRVIVHAEVFRNWLSDFGLKKCMVVPHGVFTFPQSEEAVPSSPKNADTILFFGFLSPRKGLEALVKSFSILRGRLPTARLIIAGQESTQYRGYGRTVVRLVEDLNMENDVRFAGFVSDDELPKMIRGCDLVVLPYPNSIAASGPLAWAVSLGKPIVATRTPYFAEFLRDGYDAILVEPDDEPGLAAAMERVLTDKDLQSRMSDNIKKSFSDKTWDDVAGQTVGIYTALLQKPFVNASDAVPV